ncbi:hypothetical protein [Saccharopolyspora gregorii]|uniref:hypothetical protein n=1 Tax=Saccharopolyspora gregorii TaxID=33914 RepID=UPI0021ABB305|nr:hypothetical protein [Saccharopolyspora gregorii]
MSSGDEERGGSTRDGQLRRLAELDSLLRAPAARPAAHDEALLCLLECACRAARALGRAELDGRDRELLHEALRAARAAATCVAYAMSCPGPGARP